jgi:hypothetical protein
MEYVNVTNNAFSLHNTNKSKLDFNFLIFDAKPNTTIFFALLYLKRLRRISLINYIIKLVNYIIKSLINTIRYIYIKYLLNFILSIKGWLLFLLVKISICLNLNINALNSQKIKPIYQFMKNNNYIASKYSNVINNKY